MNLFRVGISLIFLLSPLAHALDQSVAYLRTGIQAGIINGASVSVRGTAFILNLESRLSYGYFINTFFLGGGLRFAVGERNEIFLNMGIDEVYSSHGEVKLSSGMIVDIQNERKFGRNRLSTYAAFGIGLYPEDNEKNVVYILPAVRVGISKQMVGF
jgi:hypothetical protein